MKIGVLSDLHLGYRQYGLQEREEDFYLQFFSCIKELKKNHVDLVIIAGDLFDKPTPSPKAMDVYRRGIEDLGVPVVTIKGNHTMLMRKNHYSVDNFFDAESFNFDYTLLDDDTYFFNDVVIQGMYYRGDSNLDEFIEKQKEMAKKISESENTYNILVLHQAFKEYCGFSNVELSIQDIDFRPYDLIICGHIHSHVYENIESNVGFNENIGSWFLQPGSIERMNSAEAKDGQENGKGVWMIETDDNCIEFYPVDFSRYFLLGDIEFNSEEEVEEHFEELEKACSKLNNQPIISYKYYDNTKSMVRIRELMKESSKYCLINNSNIYDMVEEEIVVEITDDEIPAVCDVIKIQKGLDNEEIKLATDIYEAYTNNLDESVDGLISSFFDKRKGRKKASNNKIKQIDKDIKEFEDFFNNLGSNVNV